MRIDLEHLPTDPTTLHNLVRDMASVVTQHEEQIARLQLIIRQFQRAQFGRRSEQLSDDQLALGLEDSECDVSAATPQTSRSKIDQSEVTESPSRRKPLPASLPREDRCIDIDTSVCSLW